MKRGRSARPTPVAIHSRTPALDMLRFYLGMVKQRAKQLPNGFVMLTGGEVKTEGCTSYSQEDAFELMLRFLEPFEKRFWKDREADRIAGQNSI